MKSTFISICLLATITFLPGSSIAQEQVIETKPIPPNPAELLPAEPVLASNESETRRTHEQLQGTLWLQQSLEYAIATTQAYNNAKEMLPKLLTDKEHVASLEYRRDYSSLPPAIIMDVDETVLSNAAFQARMVQADGTFNEDDWGDWVSEAKAEAIAGAVEFIHYARSQGVAVFFITNRTADGEAATVKNLSTELSITVTPEYVLCKNEQPNWGSDKTTRREEVAGAFRVIMMFGDDFNDFAFLGKVSSSERKRRGMKFANRFGHSWFLLPNPLYGNWDKAIYNYDYSTKDADVLKLKYDLLQTEEDTVR